MVDLSEAICLLQIMQSLWDGVSNSTMGLHTDIPTRWHNTTGKKRRLCMNKTNKVKDEAEGSARISPKGSSAWSWSSRRQTKASFSLLSWSVAKSPQDSAPCIQHDSGEEHMLIWFPHRHSVTATQKEQKNPNKKQKNPEKYLVLRFIFPKLILHSLNPSPNLFY